MITEQLCFLIRLNWDAYGGSSIRLGLAGRRQVLGTMGVLEGRREGTQGRGGGGTLSTGKWREEIHVYV